MHQSRSNHTPVTLQSHSSYAPVMHQSHSSHTPVTLQLRSSFAPVTLQSHSSHTPVILQSHSSYATVTLQSRSSHTPVTLQLRSSYAPVTLQSHSSHVPPLYCFMPDYYCHKSHYSHVFLTVSYPHSLPHVTLTLPTYSPHADASAHLHSKSLPIPLKNPTLLHIAPIHI